MKQTFYTSKQFTFNSTLTRKTWKLCLIEKVLEYLSEAKYKIRGVLILKNTRCIIELILKNTYI